MIPCRHRRRPRRPEYTPPTRLPSRCLRASAVLALAACALGAAAQTLTIGSKRFTESYILAEIVRQTAATAGEGPVAARLGLGNTAIVFNALTSGAIDAYPEYSGTLAREVLRLDTVPPLAELNALLAPHGLAASFPFGFNNSYALAMREDQARRLAIGRLSDLAQHGELRLGLSPEFIGRADGWPGLKRAYGLPFATPRGLDHGIAYEAAAAGEVDVIDVYSTDAKIAHYHLRVLVDDRAYFPRYDALLVHRADAARRFPGAWRALAGLEGRIDEATMIRLNGEAELAGRDFAAIAADFVRGTSAGSGAARTGFAERLLGPDLPRLAAEHLALVFASLAASVAIGVPLGVVAARRARWGGPILAAVGVIQTIPALALLAFLITATGRIGALPAFLALSLYALLPIVRNTHTGLTQIPRSMSDAAAALGLTAGTVLWAIELPLARATILAGVKTSAVINVGTATIAAFVGAGGFGERIVTGLALNDNVALLAGAIPAAALALAIEASFRAVEHWATPLGLRLPRRGA